jgi:formamidopyrimidine-DNA glycosylase
MPELPEITVRAREMQEALVGKTISGIEVLQPKCLNVPPDAFADALTGATLRGVSNRGKWLFVETTKGWLLLNLGMGGEILLVTRDTLPEKHRLVFDFDDGTCLSLNFWWFGYAHCVPEKELDSHSMTAKLGPNALDVTLGELRAMLRGRRGGIKSFLLNQSNVAGIGNAYVHDILFLARLHPLRSIASLTDDEVAGLAAGIRDGLQPSIDKGGAFYEPGLHGQKGGFTMNDILVGYRAGKPCPECGTPIEKIKTGSTSSFICPACQPRA